MKRLLVLLLSFVLFAVLMSGSVFADEAVPEETETFDAADNAADPAAEGSSGASAGTKTVEAPLSESGEIIIGDYSQIEIGTDLVSISEADIQSYIDSVVSYGTKTEVITEGVAENGDTVNIDFSGRLADAEEPFDGGTAEGYELVLGSGAFIPGFEEQLIGHSIGETFDINVTFPDEYAADLAGKDAVFTITINSKTQIVVPELNDEFVKEISFELFGEELDSVEALRNYTNDSLYHNALHSAIMNALNARTEIISYPEDKFNIMKAYSEESLNYYVSMYASAGMTDYDADSLAQMSGYATANDYTSDEAMNYLNMFMLLDKIAEDQGIEITDEEVDEAVLKYMKSYGVDETYSVEEFKELSGEAWLLLMKELNVKYNKVMEALEPNAVFVKNVITYFDYANAAIDDEVTVDVYVQDTQSWWDGTISVYAADKDGGYFIYNMACTEEDSKKLVPGTKIRVTGFKAEWSGEIEIADAVFEFIEDDDPGYIAEASDVTDFLGTSSLESFMNQFVSFKGLTIAPSQDADGNEAAFLYNWDGSGTQGDDIYFNVSYNDEVFTFTVESYLRDQSTDVYKTVESLNIGDTVDLEGFLYWYNGANPHITSVTVK